MTHPIVPDADEIDESSESIFPELLTLDAITARYHLSRDTVGDWLRTGELIGFKLGKRWFVRPADWAAFVEARRARARPFRFRSLI